MKKLIISAIMICISSSCFGIISDLGLDPLDQTSGARPVGMGGAFTSISGDLNSMFYNPAGITDTRGVVLTARSLKDYSLGVAYDTQAGNFGIGIKSDISESLSLITPESNYENSLIFIAYGIDVGSVSLGISAKSLLSQRLSVKGMSDLDSTGGSAVDLGAIWHPLDWMSLGGVIHNGLGSKYTIESSDETFPAITILGASFNVLGSRGIFNNDSYDLLLAYDYLSGKYGDNQEPGSSYGAEFAMWKWLFIRGGGGSRFYNGKGVDYSSFGVGIKNGSLSIDLASTLDPYSGSQFAYLSFTYLPPKAEFMQFIPAVVQQQEQQAPEVKREMLTIRSPADEITVYDDRITIEGEADPKSQVLINGAVAYVADDWKLAVVQPLIPGKNLIVIEASLNGEKTRIERKVFRKARVVIAEEEGLNKQADEVQSKETELTKQEAEINTAKQKGEDVSAKEKELAVEKNAVENKKQQLTQEKLQMEERKGKVENLVNLGVIEVAPQTSFQIEAPIKRGEMLTWLVKAAGLPIPVVSEPVCADVPQDRPDAPYIKAALDAGLIKLSSDNKFRPDDPVTDEEGQQFFKAFGVVK